MRKFLSLALLAMLATGCSYTDAGYGSGTIEAMATIDYDFVTDTSTAHLLLLKENAPLTGVEATLEDGQSEYNFTADSNSEYNYSLELPGYHRFVQLKVTGSNDKLWVALEGPAHGVIVTPEQNGQIVYDKDKKLAVQWRADDGLAADFVSLYFAAADYGQTVTSDNGEADVSMAYLQPGLESLTLTRCNTVEMAGGTTGSVFNMCYKVTNIFQLFQK